MAALSRDQERRIAQGENSLQAATVHTMEEVREAQDPRTIQMSVLEDYVFDALTPVLVLYSWILCPLR